MLGNQLLAFGGGVRRGIVWVLPSWGAVRRLTRRLLTVGLLLAGIGLESLAGIARAGPAATGPFHTGYVAIGFSCLALALVVPVSYLLVAFVTATGSLLGRRVVALGRAVTAVVGPRRTDPHRRSRPR